MTKYLPALTILAGIIAAPPARAAAPTQEESAPWQVKPDPLPWKMDGSFQAGKPIKLTGSNSVVFPTSPSPFVGVITPGVKKEASRLTIYDLRGMAPVGPSIKHDKIQHSFVRVSPWGNHFAVIDNKADRPTVWLGTVTDEKIVPSIVPHDGKEKIECCDFVGKDQIITLMEVDRKRTWRIWNVKTGKEVLSFDYPLEYAENWMAFSPGRRYLAMQETHTRSYHLLFWDLRTGKLAGKILMQDANAPWGQCGNIAFSMDGKEAALLWRLHKGDVLAKIMRFDLEKGTKIGELTLGKELEPSDPGFLAGGMRTFQFLPDDRGWLVSGCQIIERQTGAPVWTLEPRPKYAGMTQNRRFLDAAHVTNETKDKKLQILTLPGDELDNALKQARLTVRAVKN